MIDPILIALLRRSKGSGDGSSSTTIVTKDTGIVVEQKTSAAVWNISHGLNRYPSVTVVDSGGNVVIGDILYLDSNSVQITFSAPFSGKAIFS